MSFCGVLCTCMICNCFASIKKIVQFKISVSLLFGICLLNTIYSIIKIVSNEMLRTFLHLIKQWASKQNAFIEHLVNSKCLTVGKQWKKCFGGHLPQTKYCEQNW